MGCGNKSLPTDFQCVFSHGACPFQCSSVTFPDCGVCDWRETISHISLAWCQRTSGLKQALAQAPLHQTSTVKHLTHYANVTLGPFFLAESPEILPRTLFAPTSFPEDLLFRRKKLS